MVVGVNGFEICHEIRNAAFLHTPKARDGERTEFVSLADEK